MKAINFYKPDGKTIEYTGITAVEIHKELKTISFKYDNAVLTSNLPFILLNDKKEEKNG